MNTMKLQIDFHQQDEASLFLESDAVGDLQPFGEVLLFSALALRQLHNLGPGPASSVLASTLMMIKTDLDTFISTQPPDSPKIVDFRGTPGRKRFLADLEFEMDRARFFLHPKGFGILGQGVNYYAPQSVLLLFKFLAARRESDPQFTRSLAEAASVCSMVYQQGKVTHTTQTGLAVGIARHALGYPV